MTENLTDQVLSALNAEGIPAFREFPQPERKLPAGVFFVTAAVSGVECGVPVPCENGTATPVVMSVRLRYHCRTDADLALHTAQADEILLRVLRNVNCGIRKMIRGEIRYPKQLDRLEQETVFVIDGMLWDITEGEDAS